MQFPINYFSVIFSSKKLFTRRSQLNIWQSIFIIVVFVGLAMFPLSLIVGNMQTVDLAQFTPKAIASLDNEHLVTFNKIVNKQREDLIDEIEQLEIHSYSSVSFAKNGFLIQEENKPPIKQKFIEKISLEEVATTDELVAQLSNHWFAENRLEIILTQFINLWLLVFISYITLLIGTTLFIGLMKNIQYFSIKSFSDAFGLAVHALALPTILATILASVTKNVMIVTYGQSIIFVLWLLYIYWQTHFNDQYNQMKE